jgi:hypothetical protein
LPASLLDNEAYMLEKRYRWQEAADRYREALENIHGQLGRAEAIERTGFCIHRAAYQSKTNEMFKARVEAARQQYEEAAALFSEADHEASEARKHHCLSQVRHLEHLLQDDPQERRALLDRSLEEEKKALDMWSMIGEPSGYIEACNGYLSHLYYRLELVWDSEEAALILEEAMERSEAAEKVAGEDHGRPELTWTRHLLSLILLDKPMEVYSSIKRQQEVMKTSFDNATRAYGEAVELGDAYLIGRTCGVLGYVTFEINGDLEASLRYANLQLESAEKTDDVLLKAQAYELLGYLTAWKTNTTDEDRETQTSENLKAYQYTEKALEYYEVISKPVILAYINHVGSHYHLTRNEEKVEAKLEIMRKGVEVAKKDLVRARGSGSQLGTLFILNELLHLLFGLIKYENADEEKKRLMEEADSTVGELIEVSTRMQPFRYWNHSVFKFQSARLKIARSRLETDQHRRIELLKEALLEGDECAELGKIHLNTNPSTALYLDYAVGLRQLGELLDYLYTVTKDTQYLDRAIGTYREILRAYAENDLPCRMAETHWRIAAIREKLGQYMEAAEEFEAAAASYDDAANKIPHHKEFYTDYSIYMKALSEIEKAKHHNLEKRYDKVREHYERAAELHRATNRWSYLSKYYSAWAKLAEAEALSQEDDTEDAKSLFGEIVAYFKESKDAIEAQFGEIHVRDEQEMARSLIDASELRSEYCRGRVTLEEARMLVRSGDQAASSRKYDESTRTFKRLYDAVDTEAERGEIAPIICLCEAWKMMTLAEAEAAPQHYHEAAGLFEKAKDLSLTQQTKLLALGHSNFCRALYECTMFETKRDMGAHKMASHYLTSATNFYVRAGYEPALEYSKATQRLFDAYVYMDNANLETEPEKKARYYAMAERVLEASADSFLKAQHPAKEEEVNRLLENIRKDRKLAMSLIDMLHAPLISSSTESFSAPTPTHEYAAGLESFEQANLHAGLYVKSKEIEKGEAFDVVIELYNPGMTSAALIKIEEIISENFEVIMVSGIFGVKDDYLDLKGKRLGPLSTEEITVSLNPLSKGDYTIKPCVVYIDEAGELKHCEAEPLKVSVSEMGILGWISGRRPL